MANMSDVAQWLTGAGSLCRAEVISFSESGLVHVRSAGAMAEIDCELLNPDSSSASLSQGDAVLVWVDPISPSRTGVILGRTGPQVPRPHSVVPADEFAKRPKTLVIETQGDLILRNGQARITLGALGDIDISCNSFATRSQRLLRLLAPIIKLN